MDNDLGVESGFVESPFWHFFVRQEFTVYWRHVDSELSSTQGCNEERLKERNHGTHSTKQPSKVANNYDA